jgi:hypothetical protein
VICAPGQACWPYECSALRPFCAKGLEKTAIRREDLDAMIVGIGDIQPAGAIDHDAAGLSELSSVAPFLPEGHGRSIRPGFNIGQEGTGKQEDKGDEAADETDGTATTEASHGLIHHHEQ